MDKNFRSILIVLLITITSCKNNKNENRLITQSSTQIVFTHGATKAAQKVNILELNLADEEGGSVKDISTQNFLTVDGFSVSQDLSKVIFNAKVDVREGVWDIYAYPNNNSDFLRISNELSNSVVISRVNPEHNVFSDAQYAPDGKSVAAVKWNNISSDVVILDLEGNIVINFTQRLNFEIPRNYSPRWSPDGEQLAFSARVRDEEELDRFVWRLCVVNKNGTNSQFIGSPSADIIRPLWSPDGKHLIYNATELNDDLSLRLKTSRIVMLNGAEDRWLAHELNDVEIDGWFRSAERVYGTAVFDQGQREVVIINSKTGDFKRLTNSEVVETSGKTDLSPDEQWILFTHGNDAKYPGNTQNLWKVKIDGSGLQQLTFMNYVREGKWARLPVEF